MDNRTSIIDQMIHMDNTTSKANYFQSSVQDDDLLFSAIDFNCLINVIILHTNVRNNKVIWMDVC